MNNPVKIRMLNLPRMHQPFQQELEDTFSEISQSGQYINGPYVTQFESDLSAVLQQKYALGTSSGTDALLVALMALGVQPGDEIITPNYTFFATAGTIARLGAVPVFVDISPSDFNIDPARLEAAMTPRTKGIIPVHLFGKCARMSPIMDIANARDLFVLEDAAQAIGATCNGQRAGSMGNAGILSFFPAKNLGALGDAGAVITNDDALAEKISILRKHGATKRFHHDFIGGNFRIDALQAAILSIKLKYLHKWEAGREATAAYYNDAFANIDGIGLPQTSPGNRHVFNQYVMMLSSRAQRDKLQQDLNRAGIGSAIYYPVPLNEQPCFSHLPSAVQAFPQSRSCADQSIAIPVDPCLSDSEKQAITTTVLTSLS